LYFRFHFEFSTPEKPLALGHGQLRLKDITSNSVQEKTVQLKDPTSGNSAGDARISVEVLSVEEANAVQEHMIYEFQRWNPLKDWGEEENPEDSLLSTDPGR
jgi:hypothetical protein